MAVVPFLPLAASRGQDGGVSKALVFLSKLPKRIRRYHEEIFSWTWVPQKQFARPFFWDPSGIVATQLASGSHRWQLELRTQGCTMKVPVAVLRLPRGPDGSRGFDPNSLRFQTLGPASLSSVGSGNAADVEQEQQSRVALRERYLRSLRAMTGRPVDFTMYERVRVTALFGASDIDILNFQVSELQTPLGIQKEALLRCSDIIAYSFEL